MDQTSLSESQHAASSESMIVDAVPRHGSAPIGFIENLSDSRPNAVSRHNSRTFEHGIELVGGQSAERLDRSRRPANLNVIDFLGRAKAEVQARIIL